MIERIFHKKQEIAIIIRNSFSKEGVEFLTPNAYSQQIGYMGWPAGYIIQPHIHNPVVREVLFTKEVIFVKSGKIRVDFYNDDKEYLESRILEKGDVILLAFGGHGFQMLEHSEMIEVKQGPYAGEEDKTRFEYKIQDNLCYGKV
jgi:hypothetical protein